METIMIQNLIEPEEVEQTLRIGVITLVEEKVLALKVLQDPSHHQGDNKEVVEEEEDSHQSIHCHQHLLD
jgi:hypothetical protein